jgi:hypothetical protein
MSRVNFRESIPFNGREVLNLAVNYLEPGMYVIFFKFDNGFRLTKKLSITGTILIEFSFVDEKFSSLTL